MLRFLTIAMMCSFLPLMTAEASDPVWFTCTVAQGDARLGGGTSLSLGSLGDMDGQSYWLLQGDLTVPSPSYSYIFLDKGGYGELILKGPEDIAPQVISKLLLQARVKNSGGAVEDNYRIKVIKDFHWGAEEFSCAM